MAATNEELAGISGGASGFADALLGGLKANQEREDAKNKFAAYMELQRELAGNKSVSGQELVDYATTLLGIPENDPRLAAVSRDKRYNIALGQKWIDNLSNLKAAGIKDVGATERAKIKAATPKAGAKPAAFKPEAAAKATLENLLVRRGYRKNTPLNTLKEKDMQDILAAWPEELGASIKAAGRESEIEPSAPFEVVSQPGTFWGTNKQINVLPGYRVRGGGSAPAPAVGGQPAAAPAPGAVPPPSLPAPKAAPTMEAVGADREILELEAKKKRDKFRKI